MSLRRLGPFVSINVASVLIICEWKAKRRKAAGGLRAITSSLHLVLEPGDTEAPPVRSSKNNHVTLRNGGITDTGNCIAGRTLALSLEAFIFSSFCKTASLRGRKLCILHRIYHSRLTHKVIIFRLLAQVTLHVFGLSLYFSVSVTASFFSFVASKPEKQPSGSYFH